MRRAARSPCLPLLLLVAGPALIVALLLPSPAAAQSSVVSELWREWAVLEKQWRVERAEVDIDRARLRARRDGRDPDAAEKPARRQAKTK